MQETVENSAIMTARKQPSWALVYATQTTFPSYKEGITYARSKHASRSWFLSAGVSAKIYDHVT